MRFNVIAKFTLVFDDAGYPPRDMDIDSVRNAVKSLLADEEVMVEDNAGDEFWSPTNPVEVEVEEAH